MRDRKGTYCLATNCLCLFSVEIDLIMFTDICNRYRVASCGGFEPGIYIPFRY